MDFRGLFFNVFFEIVGNKMCLCPSGQVDGCNPSYGGSSPSRHSRLSRRLVGEIANLIRSRLCVRAAPRQLICRGNGA